MIAEQNSLKHDLLSLLSRFNEGSAPDLDVAKVTELVDQLAPLSPIQDATHNLGSVAGSWGNLYAFFGAGRSKGKSHHDDSSLALQTFRAFPDVPIHVTDIVQEIGEDPPLYNNVILFKTMDDALAGIIIVHGVYECDAQDSSRFRVTFHSAEIRGSSGVSDADVRRCLGWSDDYELRRDFKPARLFSDVVYLDDTIRINKGGMGGLYVLERRAGPGISL